MTVLITGASSGIGYELAKIFAREGNDLVIIARSKDKIIELKEQLINEHKVNVEAIVADLSQPSTPETIYESIKSKGIKVKTLINNAGFGDYGYFKDADLKKTEEMINLNILALTKLTRLFINDIIEAKGMIMNVASVAAFIPGPLMSVYYATKAYVLSFSQALAEELNDYEVTVTALCPGPTTSGFQEAANLEESKMFKGRKLPISYEVAEYAYNSLLGGKRVAVHGVQNKILAQTLKFFPRKTVTKMVKKMSEKEKII